MARRRETRSQTVPQAQRYTIRDFRAEFPTEDACLEWLLHRLHPNGVFCGKCQRVTKHHRVAKRKSYSCQFCGHHVHPTAGTIFHKSSTPLDLWFYAIFLMSQTRCGIAAKQLQRELGVTYKTAWRMFKQIRQMLGEDTRIGGPGSTVEADETYVGGRPRRRQLGSPKPPRITRFSNKTPVFAAVERGGRVVVKAVPNLRKAGIVDEFRLRVLPRSMVYTDESTIYHDITDYGYGHQTILHGAYIYVRGDVHTNTIENFFGLVKGGLRGVYKHVGEKYLQSYLDEYAFRYNHRDEMRPMFKLVLDWATRPLVV